MLENGSGVASLSTAHDLEATGHDIFGIAVCKAQEGTALRSSLGAAMRVQDRLVGRRPGPVSREFSQWLHEPPGRARSSAAPGRGGREGQGSKSIRGRARLLRRRWGVGPAELLATAARKEPRSDSGSTPGSVSARPSRRYARMPRPFGGLPTPGSLHRSPYSPYQRRQRKVSGGREWSRRSCGECPEKTWLARISSVCSMMAARKTAAKRTSRMDDRVSTRLTVGS